MIGKRYRNASNAQAQCAVALYVTFQLSRMELSVMTCGQQLLIPSTPMTATLPFLVMPSFLLACLT